MTAASERTRIGIVGYGNLGRGVEAAAAANDDIELVGVFTRRPPASVEAALPATEVLAFDSIAARAAEIDVLVLCGGSKEDLPRQGPALAGSFNIVDSFDTHARIPEHFEAIDAAARAGARTAVISTGWDPGLFSLHRLYGEAILPAGETHTFWGRGVSQGHSDALRRVPGVADAVQYTVPSPEAIEAARAGSADGPARDAHRRECLVVLEEGADAAAVREAIVTMPHYFEGYRTEVRFVSAEELARDHGGMPHGGVVVRAGRTGDEHRHVVEYGLSLEDNPGFTASVLVAYARAAQRLALAGDHGAKTVFDVAPGLLSPRSPAELRAELL